MLIFLRHIERVWNSTENLSSDFPYDKFRIWLATTKYTHSTASVSEWFMIYIGKIKYHFLFHSYLDFRYYPRSNEFSKLLNKSGMYRNYSLNTLMDKSRIWNIHSSLFKVSLLLEMYAGISKGYAPWVDTVLIGLSHLRIEKNLIKTNISLKSYC